MKKVIENLEKYNSEIYDKIYEMLCELQTKSSSDNVGNFAYKHYVLNDSNHNGIITLKESTNFVMNGTTGLCSWQASIALSDYLLHNSHKIKNKIILELGSGTGLCGLIILKYCNISKIILSDGSLKVIDLLQENLKINFENFNLKHEFNNFKLFEIKKIEIGIWHLLWQNIVEEYDNDKIKEIITPDIILAADVIYDEEILPILIQTIDFLFTKRNNTCHMYLGATIRNENTFGKFLQLLGEI